MSNYTKALHETDTRNDVPMVYTSDLMVTRLGYAHPHPIPAFLQELLKRLQRKEFQIMSHFKHGRTAKPDSISKTGARHYFNATEKDEQVVIHLMVAENMCFTDLFRKLIHEEAARLGYVVGSRPYTG